MAQIIDQARLRANESRPRRRVLQSSIFSTALLSLALSSITTVSFPTTVSAAIYKCADANGGVTYTQTPCVGANETQKVLAENANKKPKVDCRIANNFARSTAMAMRSGQSSGDVFANYGGIDALPRTSIGVISYVYSHKDNVNTDVNRITALSAARCSAGSYGPVTCDDFPYNFVADLGGCDAAAMSTMKKPIAAQAPESPPIDNTQALGVRTAPDVGTASDACKQNVQEQLAKLFSQMRDGQTASAQQKLQTQKQQLRMKLSAC